MQPGFPNGTFLRRGRKPLSANDVHEAFFYPAPPSRECTALSRRSECGVCRIYIAGCASVASSSGARSSLSARRIANTGEVEGMSTSRTGSAPSSFFSKNSHRKAYRPGVSDNGTDSDTEATSTFPSDGTSKGTSITRIARLLTSSSCLDTLNSIMCCPSSTSDRNDALPGLQANPWSTCTCSQSLNGC